MTGYDVVVLGEPLVEISTTKPFANDVPARLWAKAVAVTCGSRGVHLDDGGRPRWYEAVPAPAVVDQTGAGDVFAGTVTARLALGDHLGDAVRLGAAAASLAVGGQGVTGRIASLDEVRAHAGVSA